MKTLREQIADGIACWCRNIPKGHPDHKEASELSDLVTDILGEIKKGPIAEMLEGLGVVASPDCWEWIYCRVCCGEGYGGKFNTLKKATFSHKTDCDLAAILKELKK
jgi:hypothetical protein